MVRSLTNEEMGRWIEARAEPELPYSDCHRNQGASINGQKARGYAVPCWGRACLECGPTRAEMLAVDIRKFYGERAWYGLTTETEHKRLRSLTTSRKVVLDAGMSSFPTGEFGYHTLSKVELPGLEWVLLTDELINAIATEWHLAAKGRRSKWCRAFGKAMTACCSTSTKRDESDGVAVILPPETPWASIEFAAGMHGVALSGTHRQWTAEGGDLWGMMWSLGAFAPGYSHIMEAEPIPAEHKLPAPL